MKDITKICETSWLMGVDLAATGRQLKALRRKNGLTQDFLSDIFDAAGDSASRVIISMWENGKTLPSLPHIVFLAELYGVTLDELVISYRRSREDGDGDPLVPFSPHICLLTGTCLCRCSFFCTEYEGISHQKPYVNHWLIESRKQTCYATGTG